MCSSDLGSAGLLGAPEDDALAKLKDKMAEQKATKQKQIEAAVKEPKADK